MSAAVKMKLITDHPSAMDMNVRMADSCGNCFYLKQYLTGGAIHCIGIQPMSYWRTAKYLICDNWTPVEERWNRNR